MNVQTLLNKIIQKQNLEASETSFLLSEIMRGNVSDIKIGALLTALTMKGETVEEIIGFIKVMREQMISLHCNDAIDVCGTGGDGKETFNISTAVAFVVAGAGVKVAKHGNRAVSSKCGSADVLEELGVDIMVASQQAKSLLQKIDIAFLFAPLFHPSMKVVSLVRKELGIRTVFNYLGPFCNPANVKKQLIGVPSIAIAEKLIQVGSLLGYEHLILATAEDGLDEISITHPTHIYELKHNTVSHKLLDPKVYGFDYKSENLRGGDAKVNAAIITTILNGDIGQRRDIVVLNSAVALYVSDKVVSIEEGIKLAQQSIDSGRAKDVLTNMKKR